MKKKMKKGLVFQIVVGGLLVIYTVIFASLFYFTFVNSLKDSWSFSIDPVGLPKKGEWMWSNYRRIFENLHMQENVRAKTYYLWDMFLGSMWYAALSALGFVIATTLMAYACAMFPCKMSSVIYFIAMFIITVPIIGSLPSEMKMIKDLHFWRHVESTFILKFTFGNVYFLLLYESIRRIPKDYAEAAEIDGASMLRIMCEIVLPLVGNIIGSIFLVQFVAFWNDYSTPMLYFPNAANLSVGMIDFAFSTSGTIAEEPYKLGSCLIALVPILIVFVIFQRKLIGGISAGGIKG